VDVDDVGERGEARDQGLVDGQVARVVRGRVVQRPKQPPARVDEGLQIVQEHLRRRQAAGSSGSFR
jgi:hypothetical protein